MRRVASLLSITLMTCRGCGNTFYTREPGAENLFHAQPPTLKPAPKRWSLIPQVRVRVRVRLGSTRTARRTGPAIPPEAAQEAA